jgi:hypothetical protein
MTEHIVCRNFDEIGIGFFDLVDVSLNVLHVGEIFDRALFAGCDDESLFTDSQRHLGLARLKFYRLR